MHANAKNALTPQIEGMLKQLRVDGGFPNIHRAFKHVDGVANAIAKAVSPWMTSSEGWSFLVERLFALISPLTRENSDAAKGSCWDFVGNVAAQAFVSETVEFLDSIPREYTLQLKLFPSVDGFQPFDISEALGLVCQKSPPEAAGLLGNALGRPREFIFLKTTQTGYCDSSLTTPVARRAISSFKVVLQQLIYWKIVEPSTRWSLGGLTLFANEHRVPSAELQWSDNSQLHLAQTAIPLPLEFSRFMSGLELNRSTTPVDEAIKNGRLHEVLRETLTPAEKLLSAVSSDADALRTASEWCLDSLVSENETLKFIQVSIGFEALLGEEGETERLTKTLADRCAFLLGGGAAARRVVREQFQRFYKARSKIVHGRRSELSQDERDLLTWGNEVLETLIAKELSSAL